MMATGKTVNETVLERTAHLVTMAVIKNNIQADGKMTKDM